MGLMRYLIFQTIEEAIQAEIAISISMGLSKPAVNRVTGDVDETIQHTEKWAEPIELNTGEWAFPEPPISYNNDYVSREITIDDIKKHESTPF